MAKMLKLFKSFHLTYGTFFRVTGDCTLDE